MSKEKDYSNYPGSDMYESNNNQETFEEKIEKVVEDYCAPEHITDDIKDFLFGSGNIYTILEIAKEELKK